MPTWRLPSICLIIVLCLAAQSPVAQAGSGSVHLTLGNPSNAQTDVNQPLNYLIDRPQYALSYNRDQGTPNWVSWHLAAADLGTAARSNSFTADTSLPAGWYQVKTGDYTNSGYDRGHMCPSADRTATDADNQATFILTNILPQAPDNNQGPWVKLETYARDLVGQGQELYILSGGAGISMTIASGKVTVPVDTWKALLALPEGADDLARINTATHIVAVRMPNRNGIRSAAWESFRVTVDSLEATTGYDLFSAVPAKVQAILESRLDAATSVMSLTVTAGVTQTAGALTAFAVPLQLQALDAGGQPVAGAVITFAALGDTASGFFPGGYFTATVMTDAGGLATAPILIANATPGPFTVEASTAGYFAPAVFDLTVLPGDLSYVYLPLMARQ